MVCRTSGNGSAGSVPDQSREAGIASPNFREGRHPAGGFNEPVQIMTNKGLERLVKATGLQDPSKTNLQEHLEQYELTAGDLTMKYGEAPKLQ
jgi:hypothetical protein